MSVSKNMKKISKKEFKNILGPNNTVAINIKYPSDLF